MAGSCLTAAVVASSRPEVRMTMGFEAMREGRTVQAPQEEGPESDRDVLRAWRGALAKGATEGR